MKLPDFDDMTALAEKAAIAKGQIKVLEKAQKRLSAEFMQFALLHDKTYWIGGRPTTVTFEKIVAEIGTTDEDKNLMVEVTAELGRAYTVYEEASEKLQTCRDMIAVFQTESANKRKTTL